MAIGTPDVEALATFYSRLVGTAELRRHHDAHGLRSIWLELSGTLLMIERSELSAGGSRVEGVGRGAFLLAFRAAPGERTALEARAGELGAAVESRSAFTTYLRDPDGNRIAFSEYELTS